MSLFNLGAADTGNQLGIAPAGLYSGLNPVAGMQSTSPAAAMPQALQMMLIQQAVNGAGQLGQQAPIQANNFAQYANPQAQITPAMLGAMMNRSA